MTINQLLGDESIESVGAVSKHLIFNKLIFLNR